MYHYPTEPSNYAYHHPDPGSGVVQASSSLDGSPPGYTPGITCALPPTPSSCLYNEYPATNAPQAPLQYYADCQTMLVPASQTDSSCLLGHSSHVTHDATPLGVPLPPPAAMAPLTANSACLPHDTRAQQLV